MGPAWIAADWGTSNLRLWLMGSAGEVLASRSSDQGMGGLAPDQFEPVLLDLLGDDLPSGRATPVLICGMAGSRQGWREAPYVTAPCAPPGLGEARSVPDTDPRLAVRILPGIRQLQPPDVMRGEEVQIAGFLAGSADFDGVLCLPGTHTKWARISAGEVVGFRTFMTGELFALLAKHSVLRHSVATYGWEDAAFDQAVSDAIAKPQNLATDLFAIRAAGLLADTSAAVSRARLSGLLIGAELQAARGYWLGQEVALIGAKTLTGLYASALAAQGVTALTAGAEDMTLAGLRAAYHSLETHP